MGALALAARSPYPNAMTRDEADPPPRVRGATMKRAANSQPEPEMLEEYDFSGGVRGKYAQRYAEGSNIVVLSPDVAEAFPDSESVNRALRLLIDIARRRIKKAGQ